MGNKSFKMGIKEPNTSSDDPNPPPGIIQISGSVWQLYEGAGDPKMDVIFFHGLPMGDFRNAFWKTWQSGDGTVWPKVWLAKKFPCARIFSVSYDSSAAGTEGHGDFFSLPENLVKDIILDPFKIGKTCPVVLVGHSLGGIAIKHFLLSANRKRHLLRAETSICEEIKTFLQNVRGIFYYSTPHDGSRIAKLAALYPHRSPYFNLLMSLNGATGRINDEFRQHRRNFDLKVAGIGEKLPTSYMGFRLVVVSEASARSDIENYSLVPENHFDVCKPEGEGSAAFVNLCAFIANATGISQADT